MLESHVTASADGTARVPHASARAFAEKIPLLVGLEVLEDAGEGAVGELVELVGVE